MAKFQAAKNFKDFCESTSLHGYNYLHMTASITLKIFWIIVITTMTVSGMVLLVRNTLVYMQSSIVTNIESTSGNLTVSSVTLCCICLRRCCVGLETRVNIKITLVTSSKQHLTRDLSQVEKKVTDVS